MTQIEPSYANTDFDLRSPKPFDVLHAELSDACCILHYVEAQDGTWSASYEVDRMNDSATNDILAFIDVRSRLSDAAKQELAEYTVRDFNVGVNCWDTWAYNIGIPPSPLLLLRMLAARFRSRSTRCESPTGRPRSTKTAGNHRMQRRTGGQFS
ncbi:MAG: hypothetical protein AAGJ40_24220 [Planctomycetota bacterium]